MGRELKRVPLDFDWPIDKLWHGYVNPHHKPCPEDQKTCFHGATAASEWLGAACRLLVSMGVDAASAAHAEAMRSQGRRYPHPDLQEWGLAPFTSTPQLVIERLRDIPDPHERNVALNRYHRDNPPTMLPLTQELVALVEGLTGDKLCTDGVWGGSTAWGLQRKLISTAGLDPDVWGHCPVCHGQAIDPASYEAYEAWTKTHPPTGDGYQLWMTTSEGSPMSPVFTTLDELCAWCEDNATTFASCKATREEWKRMLDTNNIYHQEGDMVFM